jgi:multidrug efflux pump subunit AcrA (membrane-fusion protein)
VPRAGNGSAKLGRRRQGQGKAAVPLEFTPSEVRAAGAGEDAAGGRVLRAAGGAAHRGGTGQGAGTLLSLAVGEGSRVKAGQSIGEIDLSDLQTRVSERSAMVESAQATLLEAERQHTANVGLAAQNFISSTALQTSQARLDAARAQLKSAQAQLSVSRIGVKEASLPGADLGHRRQAPRRPGEKVSAEQQVVTIVDLGSLELAGSVGTHEVSLLRPGQEVQVRVEGQRESVPAGSTGSRPPPSRHAGDRRRRRARQQGRALSAPGSTARPGSSSPTMRRGSPCRRRGRPGLGPGLRLGDRERRPGPPRSSSPAARTGGRRVEVSKGLTAETQILAARFDNLKEGAQAKVVPQRAAASASAATGRARRRRRRRSPEPGRAPCGSPASRSTTRLRHDGDGGAVRARPVLVQPAAGRAAARHRAADRLRRRRLSGRSPDATETELTRPIELALNGIAGVKMIRSNSLEGRSETVVEFQLSADMNRAVQDVRDKVATVQPSFPRDAKQPYVSRFDGGQRPADGLPLAAQQGPERARAVAARRPGRAGSASSARPASPASMSAA